VAAGRAMPCGAEHGALLCEALRGYAQAAFPPGGSACAEAARESLLEIAARLEREQAACGSITLKGRQKGTLRGAVRVYFNELSGLPEAEASRHRELLLGLLE
jgi:hypothetical protein